ncbi:MAG: hypothetical protein U0800_12870 [Isosphaeraceae bacterium]
MPRVSWNWFARALALALVIASSGCRFLPIRRAEPISPTRGGPDADPMAPASPAPLPIAISRAEPVIPPLLEPVSDEEALGTSVAIARPPAPTPAPATAAAPAASPTPLLDAALARARAEKAMVVEAAREADPAPQPQRQPQPAKVPAPPAPPIQAALSPSAEALPPPQAEPAQDLGPEPEADTPPEPLPIAPSALTQRGPRPRPVAQSSGDPVADEAADRPRTPARDPAGRDGVIRTDLEIRPRAQDEPRPAPVDDHARQATAPMPPLPAGPIARNQPVAEAISSLDPADARPAGPIIADLALCRRVRGFAEYDAIDAASLRAGRPVIVYSQISGLRYDPTGDKFHSRLASRIELIRVGSRTVAWSQEFEPADDVCRRPRQDYYASYPLLLPAQLEPGTYHLRLIQTDTLAGLEASRELTLTLRP